MLVSVVIATYRRPLLLPEAVRSALQQDGPVEILVVDDDPDGSAAPVVAALADPRVRYLRNPTPSAGRPAAVRNFGWPQTTGPLVHFLDDDDRVPDGFYAAARAALMARPRAGLVFGTILPFGDDPATVASEQAYFAGARRQSRRCRAMGNRWGFVAQMLFNSTILVCSAAIVRRAALQEAGGFDTSLPLMEDVELFTRIMRTRGAALLDTATLHYRIGPSLMRQSAVAALTAQSAALSLRNYRARYGVVEYYTLRLAAQSLRSRHWH